MEENRWNNIVLILGNGFDLDFGLPTRYTDFLDYAFFVDKMLKGHIDSALKAVRTHFINKDIFSRIIQNHLDSILSGIFTKTDYSSFVNYIVRRNEQSSKTIQKIEKNILQEFIQWKKWLEDNEWFTYFVNKTVNNELKGKRWIDFEYEVASVIKKVDYSRYRANGNLVSLDDEVPDEIDQIFEPDYLNFHLTETTYRDFRDKAAQDLSKLRAALSYYLNTEIENIKLRAPSSSLFNALDETNSARNSFILNFNYTSTFEKVFRDSFVRPIFQQCHIHGKSSRNDSIVLGIDEYLDDMQLQRNIDFLEFRKHYQRQEKDTDQKYIAWLQELDSNYNTKIIIFGHSLGLIDSDVLHNFLTLKSIDKIDCYYYKEDMKKQQIKHLTGLLGQEQLAQFRYGMNKKLEFIQQ